MILSNTKLKTDVGTKARQKFEPVFKRKIPQEMILNHDLGSFFSDNPQRNAHKKARGMFQFFVASLTDVFDPSVPWDFRPRVELIQSDLSNTLSYTLSLTPIFFILCVSKINKEIRWVFL